MSEPARPLTTWVLLAIAPGLLCDVLAGLNNLLKVLGTDAFEGPIIVMLLIAPLVGIGYLIALAKRYLAAGMAGFSSVLTFVLGFGLVNLFLWGAGCTIIFSRLNFH